VTRGRGRPEGKGTEKHRASCDSNTHEDQCHPRKIFIGGLAHKTTTQHLRDHFGRFGSIVDAVVLRWPDGRSRGFGYVTFADSPAAASVLKETHSMSGRDVDVKRAVPGTNKLFIGGLPQNTTANELREHFEKFGVVSDAVVMIDPATSRSRGFGFVCYLPGQEGATAVTDTLAQYEHHRMRGKWIEVKSAAPPHKLAATAKQAAEAPSYEELALSGALDSMNQRLEPSPSPSIENKEPSERKRSQLGSPRKIELPGMGELCNNPLQGPPPGLAEPMAEKDLGKRPGKQAMPPFAQGWGANPWQAQPWETQPWPQPFGPGFGLSPFAPPALGYPNENGVSPFGNGYFHTPPYMDQSGLSASDTLQRNLEQFLRQSVPHKMEWHPNKGAPRDPSVSTTCSAATSSEKVSNHVL